MLRRHTWISSAVLGLSLGAAPALAGNLDTYYLSSDAALQAGAITADSQSGGSIWYNPAGLADLPQLRLDVSVNAFTIRLGGRPDIEGGAPNSQVERLTQLDFNVVPSGLTFTRRWGNVGVGLGVFVPTQQKLYLRTQVVEPSTGLSFAIDDYVQIQDYFAGPSVGIRLAPWISVGASLFVHYRNELSIGAVDASVSGEDVRVDVTRHETLDGQQFGLQAVLGVQLRPTDQWRLGLSVRLPSLRLFQFQRSIGFETLSVSTGPGTHETVFRDDTGVDSAIITPARLHFGASHDWGQLRVAAELNYQTPFDSDTLDVHLVSTLNARLGARLRVSDTVALGGGLFTDRSPEAASESLGDATIDFYGLTAALDLGTPYQVSRRGDETLSEPAELLFGTTIALSYAVGVGNVVQGRVRSDPVDGLLIEERPSDTVVHQVTLHLGTRLGE